MFAARILRPLLLALALAPAVACTAGDAADLADGSEAASSPAHFDLWQTDGLHFFHVASGNGEVLLSSEGYASRTSALNGVLAVLDHGDDPARYRVTVGADGQSYVALTAANGEIVAVTEGYASAGNARRAIDACVASIASYNELWSRAAGARFEVFQGADRQYYASLFAGNGAHVLRTEGYRSEAAALNAAFLIKERGVAPAAYQVLPAADGGFYLNLRAANHAVLATSEVYDSESNAVRARDSLMALLPTIDLL